MIGKEWTEEEVNLLKIIIGTPSIAEIAKQFNRTEKSITSKIYFLERAFFFDNSSEGITEETVKREKMFMSLVRGLTILIKVATSRTKKKYEDTQKVLITDNDGRYLYCLLDNGRRKKISKYDIVSKQVLVSKEVTNNEKRKLQTL